MIYLTSAQIAEKAEEIVKQTEGQIVMIGLPMHAEVTDQSKRVDHVCSQCDAPVQATAIKMKILELTQDLPEPAVILCPSCLLKFMETQMHGKIPDTQA